jgi:hypothetical protein
MKMLDSSADDDESWFLQSAGSGCRLDNGTSRRETLAAN